MTPWRSLTPPACRRRAWNAGWPSRWCPIRGPVTGAHLARRQQEARIGGRDAGRVAAVLAQYRPLLDVAELRLHDTVLYNSIYRFDNDMLVNVHAYGLLAAYTPVFHLRRVDGQWFETYTES